MDGDFDVTDPAPSRPSGREALGRLRTLRARAAGLRRDLDHDAVVGSGEPRLRLVVLGDSSAAGDGLDRPEVALPRRLAEELARRTGRAVAVRSFARSGARTADVASSQVPRLAEAEPDAVAVVAGMNDALGRRPPRRVEADTRALLAAVTAAAPAARIVLLTCPDVSRAPGLPSFLRPPVGWLTRRTARAQARGGRAAGVGVAVLDGPVPIEAFGPDGFHPAPSAVDVMAGRLADALSRWTDQ